MRSDRPLRCGEEGRSTVIAPVGDFFLVYISTPANVCEARDPKGEYARARAGMLAHFTGVSDPYEPPDDADIIIDTTTTSVEAAAEMIIGRLRAEGYLRMFKQATR